MANIWNGAFVERQMHLMANFQSQIGYTFDKVQLGFTFLSMKIDIRGFSKRFCSRQKSRRFFLKTEWTLQGAKSLITQFLFQAGIKNEVCPFYSSHAIRCSLGLQCTLCWIPNVGIWNQSLFALAHHQTLDTHALYLARKQLTLFSLAVNRDICTWWLRIWSLAIEPLWPLPDLIRTKPTTNSPKELKSQFAFCVLLTLAVAL